MSTVKGKKAFVINLMAQVSAILAQMIISVVLTPIVLEKMGTEAYGFVGLVNNFVSYVAVVTTALNSLAGRFITVAHHSGDKKGAASYYSSVLFSNCIMAVFVLLASILLAANIELLVSVAPALVGDLRIMVLLAFLNCALGLVSVVFGVAAFIKNQLYLNSLAQMISSILRASLLCVMFATVAPHMWYYSAAAVAASLAFFAMQFWTARRLVPEYRARVSDYSFASIIEILKSGVWASIESVNKLLLTGLDLWIANVFVGAYQMGVLSVAKTIPNALLSVSGSIASLFYPKCAELYAKKSKEALSAQFGLAMKFTAAVMIVPLAGLIVYGIDFYHLWLPDRDSGELAYIQMLSIVTVISLVSSALVEPLYYANTLAIRIKESVLITLGFSVLVLIVELALLFFTDINKLFVIASVSSIVMSVRHCVVQPLFAAHILGLPKTCFFSYIAKELLGLGAVLTSFYALSLFLPLSSWIGFVGSCLLSCVVGYCELFFVMLGGDERRKVAQMMPKKRR